MLFEAIIIIGVIFGVLYYYRNQIADFIIGKTTTAISTTVSSTAATTTNAVGNNILKMFGLAR